MQRTSHTSPRGAVERLPRIRWAVRPVSIAVVSTLLAASTLTVASAQERRPEPLPPEIAELARELAASSPDLREEPREEVDDSDPSGTDSPSAQLSAARDRASALVDTTDRTTAAALRGAVADLDRAQEVLSAGSRGLRPDHLGSVVDELGGAVADLEAAERTAGPGVGDAIADVSAQVARVGGGLVEPVLASAERVGADPAVARLARSSYVAGLEKLTAGDDRDALVQFGDSLADAGSVIEFDVELFEQNLRDALDGDTVGYTYAITQSGTLVAEDGVGDARTATDGQADQEADKQVMVASVSKPLTAILVLRLMEQEGVGPDDLIAAYLPSYWTLGAGMDQVTFRQLLTHTSGIKQLINTFPNGTFGTDYERLQDLLATDLLPGSGPGGYGPYGSSYTNLNFALQRVLVAGLMGIDPADYPEFEGSTLTASAFEIYLQSVYGSIGVPASCSPTDPVPTLMYTWPLDGSPGGESSDKVLTCGGYGFFISAHQLAGVLAHLRYTEDLLSESQFDMMRDDGLGLRDYAGDQGTYVGHAGQWNPGMRSCVMMFSIAVDAALTINSLDNGVDPSACTVVREAFDDAWVAV